VITFGAPEFFGLLAVLIAMIGAGVWYERWRRIARANFGGPQAARWPRSMSWAATLVFLGGALLIVIAAARPQWSSREINREREGVDLVIALDISQSMHANDAAPNRLQRAQDELARLVESQRGSRIGLVFFAGSAIIRSPLTSDTQAMVQLIRRSDSEAGLTRTGSDIGAALEQAAVILQDSETAGKAVLVVSDGEDHVNSYLQSLAPLREQGVLVFSAGVGTAAGSTIPATNLRTGQPQVKLAPGGQPVITRLNEATLQSIAQAGGGRYLNLASDDLVSLRDDLASLQQTPLSEQVQRLPIERFQIFAGLAFALLALSWLMPENLRLPALARRLRLRPAPGLAVALFALFLGACSGDSLGEKNAAANRLYMNESYEEALAAYEELLAERPDVPELGYNAGNTLNRLGNYERAVAETQRALPPKTTALGAATYFALGNHFFALDQLREAFDAYRGALLLDPSDGDAKYNLELTLLRLQAQPQEQDGSGPQGGQPQQLSEQQGQPQQPMPGQPAGSPQPGAAPTGTPQPTPAQIERSLQDALRGLDEAITFEQALEILNLLRQQQERQQPSSQPGGSSGPDY
jgi:Ca-activated chloride channel family protein